MVHYEQVGLVLGYVPEAGTGTWIPTLWMNARRRIMVSAPAEWIIFRGHSTPDNLCNNVNSRLRSSILSGALHPMI